MIPAPAHLNSHLTGLVHPVHAFVVDFPPVAPGFHRRTPHTPQKFGYNGQKSSHKIRHRKFPGEHFGGWVSNAAF